MDDRFTRRTFSRLLAGAGLVGQGIPCDARAQASVPAYGYPMGISGRALGDGFLIRHGYACENTWFFPGYWHTGEDWYLAEGDTAGQGVYAVADGEIVFAGSDYPGLVVIARHDDGLYAMYGHLDHTLVVETSQRVARGALLGRVLARTDGRAPSHLHFEIRTFLTTPEVNGDAPRYGFSCGFACPPGPGYWPIDAPEHPSAMGWRNPTHVINRRLWGEAIPAGAEASVTANAPDSVTLWTAPAGVAQAEQTGELALTTGDRYPLLAIDAGAEDATGTSAEATQLWYQIALLDGTAGWARAAIPSDHDAGTDGRPSSISFAFHPVVS